MPHLITAERLVGRFTVPWRGVNQEKRADELQPDELRDASNVFPRGKYGLRPRPGYSQFSSVVFTGTPTGLTPYLRGTADPVPVLATTQYLYAYDSGTWVNVTGTLQTATNLQPGRFTTIALGTPAVNYLIHTNGKDTPTRWTGVTNGSSNFTALSGTPPLWSDVCTIADHIIGVVPPYGIQWGTIRAIDTYPALNTHQAAESVDAVVALRPLGNGAGAVLYKESSLWPVSYTGGQTEATAFRIGPDPFGFWDGPASPAAVVNVSGQHVYMTPTGRIAAFSGAQHEWIADGLWPFLRADVDTTKAARIWGVYDPTFHEVHFCYPSLGASSQMRGWVGISLPKPNAGISTFGAFPGRFTGELSAAGIIRLTDKVDFILTAGTAANRSYKLTMDVKTDDGTAYAGYCQTGLLALAGLDALRLEALETFAERGDGYGALSLRMLSSWVLGNDGGTLGATTYPVNLGQTVEPVTGETGIDFQGRFAGLRYDFASSSAITLRWKGATLTALKKTGK